MLRCENQAGTVRHSLLVFLIKRERFMNEGQK
ncbi:hypothetical protein EWX12_00335 [Enterococcus faecalis]|nr:hypothetical protein [Enterococcus faecalis]EGO8411222.1 hypothetical protein [Enterococcus faecalis]EGO8413781.1 hypothetical protein [Enterococcus faecalis]EGO8457607.1 hypothetical protein [Enterococcus faecalis]EGO8769550.1 hypothetical protein [Enterococcus faecalis]